VPHWCPPLIKRIEDLLIGVHLLPLPHRLRREGLIGVLLMCPIKTFMREREREREVAQKS